MTFKDIKGHQNSIALLRSYLESDRMHSSFLFIGPQGVGKFSTAMALAKTLHCIRQDSDACAACPSCRKIDKRQHPDVHVIAAEAAAHVVSPHGADSDAAGYSAQVIKIDQIRELQRQEKLKPYEAKIKVFIIDGAHRLNAEAANCLLKTLEEPSGDSLIILITDKPNLLYKTITSRCRTVKFYPLTNVSLEETLVRDYGMLQKEAHFLACYSEGRLGLALALKDTALLEEKNRIIDGFIPTLPNQRFQAADGAGRDAARMGVIVRSERQELSFHTENRTTLRHHLNILATWFRDVYLCKAGCDAACCINADRFPEIAAAAKAYSRSALDEILKLITEAILHVEQNVNPKLIISNIRAALQVESA